MILAPHTSLCCLTAPELTGARRSRASGAASGYVASRSRCPRFEDALHFLDPELLNVVELMTKLPR